MRASGEIVSVNVGQPRRIGERKGEPVLSAIGKHPVTGPVRVEGINLAGDGQADRNVHGGRDQAVYAYAAEDAAWWAGELGREIPAGMFGENLTTRGIDWSGALIGEQWRFGSVVLEITSARIPCHKLGRVFGDPLMVKRFGEAARPGAYFRILVEGTLQTGDAIECVRIPDEHGVTVRDVAHAMLFDKSALPALAAAPQLHHELLEWIATL